LIYIDNVQQKEKLFTAETYEALVLTTKSTVACIKYLLTEGAFNFVLTRRFSGDPVEALFGSLRQASGCHYQQDAAAVTSALKKMLVTGIIASTKDGNVVEESQSRSKVLSFCQPEPSSPKPVLPEYIFPSTAIQVLNCLLQTHRNHVIPATVLNISLALVAGYIVRVVNENISCNFCIELIECPRKCTPLLELIFRQDRVGLKYPSDSLVSILCTLQRFAELSLPNVLSCNKLLDNMTQTVLPFLCKCPALQCDNPVKEECHTDKLCLLIIFKFLRPILGNYAKNVTEQQQKVNKLKNKPLSRKIITVNP